MKQSPAIAGQRLEQIRKAARSHLGTLDATVQVEVVTPEAEPPRKSYARRIEHAVKFANGTPSVSGQFRSMQKSWNQKLDPLATEVAAIESEMGLLVKSVGFLRGNDALPEGLSLELQSAFRTLKAGAQKGLPVTHIVEAITSTAVALDAELEQTRNLINRCREAGHVALSKQQSVVFEKAAGSFGHHTRKGGAYLDMALKSAGEYKRASSEYATKHFSDGSNASQKAGKALRAGQLNVVEMLK
jgi:hypothetical protein